MTGSTAVPSFCPMNLAMGSATPPRTVMAIMPTRSRPPGAISDVGAACPNAAADKPASKAAERRIRPNFLSLDRKHEPCSEPCAKILLQRVRRDLGIVQGAGVVLAGGVV